MFERLDAVFLFCPGDNADRSIRFHDRIFYVGRMADSVLPDCALQLIDGDFFPLDVRSYDLPVVDEESRCTFKEFLRRPESIKKEGEQQIEHHQRRGCNDTSKE